MVNERTEKMMRLLREQSKQDLQQGKPDIGKLILGQGKYLPAIGMYGRKKELITQLVEEQVELK